MKLYQIFRYGMMRRLKGLQNRIISDKGGRLHIALTFRCNLACPYCTNEFQLGRKPKTTEKDFDFWKDFILSWTEPLQEIKITGGSPELHPDFVRLVNWVLSRGICVQIYTNLHYLKYLNQLTPSPKLMFIATYHHCSDLKEFDANYNVLKMKYRIKVDEIDDFSLFDTWHETAKGAYKGSHKLLPYSILKPLQSIDDGITSKPTKMLRTSPVGKIYLTCYDTFIDD